MEPTAIDNATKQHFVQYGRSVERLATIKYLESLKPKQSIHRQRMLEAVVEELRQGKHLEECERPTPLKT